ncbi:MAG: carboxypeptidase-like regulatory domain-containing protein [Bacteroidales bacterium]|jgi:hypothetical protein|nr:carboxypeptidase-like regulatory domain-containing protein [Bacteroidales bacterium]
MNKRNILLLFFTLLTSIVYSQTTVTGVVISEEDSLKLPGILINEKGTDNSTVTDINGFYKITIRDSSTLIFSGMGLAAREIVFNGKKVINTSLKPYIIYEAWNQKLRFLLKNGLIENPVGGQFEFAVPTFINALSLYGSCSYTTNFRDNNFFEADIELKSVRLTYGSDFYLNLGIKSSYRKINTGNHSYKIISFESLWFSRLPFNCIIGYSQINYRNNKYPIRKGFILGTEIWIPKPLQIEVKSKINLSKSTIEYQAEIRKRFRRYHTFIKYYNIDRYSELSIGIGIEFTYLFKYQRNKY